MIAMTLPEIAASVGGTVHDDTGISVTGPAFVDSRRPEPGGLFVAFDGEHADGHQFAASALEGGGVAVLGSHPLGVPMVVVDDTETALGMLARHVLSRLEGVRVIAVTGSQGKTSTKDLLEHLLSGVGRTVATYGSFNNEIGLPLTVLRADHDTKFLVLEMGARGVGHLSALCAIAPPQVSLVLNVGKAHIGEFGSQQSIAQAKGELVDALGEDGVAVLNADDPLVSAMAARAKGSVLMFGESEHADVRVTNLRLDDSGRPRFDLAANGKGAHVEMRLLGEHQALNAVAAAGVAIALGMGVDEVARGLAEVGSTSKWRMELHERSDGVTVVNDAYNANPDSMRAALKALAALGQGRGQGSRTVAVLGEMRELGASSREEHDTIGRLAVRLGISKLVVIGEAAKPMHVGAGLEGSLDDQSMLESVFMPDNDHAVTWLRDNLVPGDVVLFKASRAAKLERVAEAVLADDNDVPGPVSSGKEDER